MFAVGAGCGPPTPLNLAGNAKTGSFNSSTGTYNAVTGTYNNQVSSGGDVGSNGGINLGGTSTAINGSLSTNLPGTVGTCPANGISKTGTPTYGTITGGAPVYTPPVPPLPSPLPPQTDYPPKKTTMPNPLPAGSYGNVTLKGAVTLADGTDINHPAIYTINSLTFNGGATLYYRPGSN
jgi:hypothetical protein